MGFSKRFGVVVLCLLSLSIPAANVCGAMAEAMDGCAMPDSHSMSDCSDEIAPSVGCCDPGGVDTSTDAVLKRPDGAGSAFVPAARGDASGTRGLTALRRWERQPAPPLRPAAYRLSSALLL